MSGTTLAVTSRGAGTRGASFSFAAPFWHLERTGAGAAGRDHGWTTAGIAALTCPGGSSPVGPRLRVLVAEDNEFNADLIRPLLQRRGQ